MSKNIEKKTTDAVEPTVNPLSTVKTIKYRNPIDLLRTLDRRSLLAGLRSITGAVQYTMINTADWMTRKEDGNAASNSPSLDERNTADEFTRGQEHVDFEASQFGTEALQSPEEKLKQYSHLYYGLVDEIRTLNPAPYERPKGLLTTLADFSPRGVGLSENDLKALEAAESEPGEFAKARDEAKAFKTEAMNQRKPRIKALLELNADCMPLIDTFEELPVHVRLRLALAAWKGIYYSRKQLVTYIGTYGKLDDLAGVKAMAIDLELLGKWCEDFEHEHRDLIEVMIEAGVKVYGIDDARIDVKKPRQQ